MAKNIKIISRDIFVNDTDKQITSDVFRDTFGAWRISKDQTNITYLQNENNFFYLSSPRVVYFDSQPKDVFGIETQPQIGESTVLNDQIIVPSIAKGSVPFVEQVFRQSFYKVKNTNQGATPLAYLRFNTRFKNLAFDQNMPNFTEDGIDYRQSAQTDDNSSEISKRKMIFDFLYQVENVEYENLANTTNNLAILPSYREIINFKKQETEQDLSVLLRDKLRRFNLGSLSGTPLSAIVTPESLDEYNTNKDILTVNPNSSVMLKEHALTPSIVQNIGNILKPPLEVPQLVRLNFPPTDQSPEILNKPFIVNNLMFFYNSLTQARTSYTDDPQFDLATTLMRWHHAFLDFLDVDDTFVHAVQNVSPGSGIPFTSVTTQSKLKSYDLIEWLNRNAPALLGLNGTIDTEIFNFDDESNAIATSSLTNSMILRFAVSKILHALSGNTKDITPEDGPEDQTYNPIINHLYTYQNMALCGGSGVSETLFYKIEKYSGQSTRGTPIQTYFIPVNPAQQGAFVDTQIFYNTDYTYVVKDVKAVMACEYEYIEVPQPQSMVSQNEYLLCVRQYPRIKIVEVPVVTQTSKILADPPITPDVSFLQIRRRRNKIRLFFSTNYGSVIANPINMTQQDLFNKTDLLSKATYGSLKTRFSDISSNKKFHVFLSETDPNLNTVNPYSTFFENIYLTSVIDSDLSTTMTGDTSTIEFSLIPNKKFYFCFVSENRLGLLSNPSDAYEVELVEDSGLTYLKYKPLNINSTVSLAEIENRNSKFSKTCKKIIRIVPAYPQTVVDTGAEIYRDLYNLNQDGNIVSSKQAKVKLGVGIDSIFAIPQQFNTPVAGKKFKVRITSKKTNRAFDINITCKHERVRSTFDSISEPNLLSIPENTQSGGTSLLDILKTERLMLTPLDNKPKNYCGLPAKNYSFTSVDILTINQQRSRATNLETYSDLAFGGQAALNGGRAMQALDAIGAEVGEITDITSDSTNLSDLQTDFYPTR